MKIKDELNELAQRYLASELSEPEAERLLRLLDDFPDLTDSFYEQIRTDFQISSLRRSGSNTLENLEMRTSGANGKFFVTLTTLERNSPVIASSVKKEPSWFSRNKRSVLWSGFGIGVVLVLVFAFVSIRNQLEGFRPGIDVSPSFTLQQHSAPKVRENASASWGDSALYFRYGERIFSNPLKLLSGLVTLEYSHGSRVTIDGPSSFEAISDARIICHEGKMHFEITPQGRDFSADFSNFTAVVKGTRFSARTTSDFTELHLYEGSVDIENILGVPSERLTLQGGQSIRVSKTEGVHLEDTKSDEIPSSEDLKKIFLEAQRKEHAEWLQAANRRLANPSLLVLLDFENQTQASTIAGSRKALTTGIRTGGTKAEGRWGNKVGMEFRSIDDQLGLTLPGSFDSLTLTASLRIDAIGNMRNNIFGSQGRTPRGLSWSITDQGHVVFAAWDKETYSYPCPIALIPDQLGNWIHLAVVVDAKSRRVKHYFNGKQVSSEAHRGGFPLVVGHAAMGKTDDMGVIRFFDGIVDEFRIYSKALSSEEIRKIAEGGF